MNNYGTFVRTLDPHVEGKLVQGGKGLDVGDKVTVKLVSTDPRAWVYRFCGVKRLLARISSEKQVKNRAPQARLQSHFGGRKGEYLCPGGA